MKNGLFERKQQLVLRMEAKVKVETVGQKIEIWDKDWQAEFSGGLDFQCDWKSSLCFLYRCTNTGLGSVPAYANDVEVTQSGGYVECGS